MTKIIAILGKSGSGKSTVADMLERMGVPPVQSHTTRPKRDENDTHHVFVSEQEFNQIEGRIAETVYGGYRYCGVLPSDDVKNIISDISYTKPTEENYDGIKTSLYHVDELAFFPSKDLTKMFQRLRNGLLPNDDTYSYVIDEVGLKMLKADKRFEVAAVLVLAPTKDRKLRTSESRFERDKDYKYGCLFDVVILNHRDMAHLEGQVEILKEKVCQK